MLILCELQVTYHDRFRTTIEHVSRRAGTPPARSDGLDDADDELELDRRFVAAAGLHPEAAALPLGLAFIGSCMSGNANRGFTVWEAATIAPVRGYLLDRLGLDRFANTHVVPLDDGLVATYLALAECPVEYRHQRR